MQVIKHILFDNDGTIVDSEHLAVDLMLEMLRPHGFEMHPDEYSRRFPGLLTKQILEIVENEHGIELPGDFIPRLHDRHEEAFDLMLQPIPGMDALFRQLRVPKSMVSNGSVAHVEKCLRRVNLLDALDGQIFSAYQVEKPKPHPDVYLLALETLQLHPHETIVVEDSPTGVAAAKSAGLRVVGFLGAAHISDGHEIQLRSAGADYLVQDARALSALFADFQLI